MYGMFLLHLHPTVHLERYVQLLENIFVLNDQHTSSFHIINWTFLSY